MEEKPNGITKDIGLEAQKKEKKPTEIILGKSLFFHPDATPPPENSFVDTLIGDLYTGGEKPVGSENSYLGRLCIPTSADAYSIGALLYTIYQFQGRALLLRIRISGDGVANPQEAKRSFLYPVVIIPWHKNYDIVSNNKQCSAVEEKERFGFIKKAFFEMVEKSLVDTKKEQEQKD